MVLLYKTIVHTAMDNILMNLQNILFSLTNVDVVDIIAVRKGDSMSDICNFLPPTAGDKDIQYWLFVYEAELNNLAQPFIRKHYCMHLAFRGNAVLQVDGKRYALTPGTLFFTHPYQSYELVDSDKFTYLYITFDGVGATPLLQQVGISKERSVFPNFGHLTEFWMNSIRRANPGNIQVLTESVLLHTLSFIEKTDAPKDVRVSREFDEILQYIHNNFADPELSIAKTADIFGFSKKYFSALFAKNMQTNFTDYLAEIRINRAMELLRQNKCSVAELAEKCGYADPLYFSKVFKKITGFSPSKY